MFEVYPARDGHRWRFVAKNGKIMADSGEAYASASNASRALRRFKKLINELEG